MNRIKKNGEKKSRLYAVSSLKRKLNQFESIHNLLRRFMAARASYAIPKKRYAILLEATPLFPEGAKNHKITINILNLRRFPSGKSKTHQAPNAIPMKITFDNIRIGYDKSSYSVHCESI